LGKYPFLNVRLALLSRTLSPGENLHDLLGPFLPYSLLDTVVWLPHVTGTEFTNRVFQMFLKEHDVHFFTTYNEETKASIVERFNRTLKTKMWKYFTHREMLGKYPFLNVRLALLSRTLSPGETLHDLLGPFLPYSLLDTVVWLAHVTSAGGMPMV
jgi:hypothetical protein